MWRPELFEAWESCNWDSAMVVIVGFDPQLVCLMYCCLFGRLLFSMAETHNRGSSEKPSAYSMETGGDPRPCSGRAPLTHSHVSSDATQGGRAAARQLLTESVSCVKARRLTVTNNVIAVQAIHL
ncbi:hypothetical protein BDA96_02G283000 [Sorghum bicolor]|uniref:Uncharacterized protein n=1 Tax=Sorghum bicolor TaxID=4558 RepID=A0A921UTZ0_SORBI|nr:hypothetical protein BDA96_02G283000 [Sorghum bicolor]